VLGPTSLFAAVKSCSSTGISNGTGRRNMQNPNSRPLCSRRCALGAPDGQDVRRCVFIPVVIAMLMAAFVSPQLARAQQQPQEVASLSLADAMSMQRPSSYAPEDKMSAVREVTLREVGASWLGRPHWFFAEDPKKFWRCSMRGLQIWTGASILGASSSATMFCRQSSARAGMLSPWILRSCVWQALFTKSMSRQGSRCLPQHGATGFG